jgi:hypothetical protein
MMGHRDLTAAIESRIPQNCVSRPSENIRTDICNLLAIDESNGLSAFINSLTGLVLGR